MTYRDALQYLFEQLPMYHRVGQSAYKKDLTNTLAFCERLGNPHRQLRCIHVGGTNGKGSVSHMLASVLQASGLKVGLYISPHYKDFRERIKVNGEVIPQREVVRFVEAHRDFVAAFQPSFFEWTVAMAFDYFHRSKVDMAVIEVGLGGRLDSTNVISPILSVITNISFDHMHMLGDTLPLIAAEKAGIIKPKTPIVIGERHPETAPVFEQKAAAEDAPIVFASDVMHPKKTTEDLEFQYFDIAIPNHLHEVALQAKGDFQRHNLATVLQSVVELRALGLDITDQHLRDGLANIRQRVGFMGRWQVISRDPLVICDSAHNEGGLRQVLAQLEAIPHGQLHIVMGFVNDKDVANVLGLFPPTAKYYFAKADIPRGLPADNLRATAAIYGLRGKAYRSVRCALSAAKKSTKTGDLVFVGGSIFVVAEVL